MNYVLYALCITVICTFRTTDALGAAYGVSHCQDKCCYLDLALPTSHSRYPNIRVACWEQSGCVSQSCCPQCPLFHELAACSLCSL